MFNENDTAKNLLMQYIAAKDELEAAEKKIEMIKDLIARHFISINQN